MKVIIINRINNTKTPATISFRKRLSNFICIKYNKTVPALTIAIRSAPATVKAPRCIPVIATDNVVSTSSITSTTACEK